MSEAEGKTGGGHEGSRLMARLDVWRANRAATATGFVAEPEPRSIGAPAVGRQLLAGRFQFAGLLLEAPGRSIWEIAPPSAGFEAALHGFGWLDDLAALGTPEAQAAARDWTMGWIAIHGRGRGAGWRADLVGRRLVRLVNHGAWLMAGRDRELRDDFFRVLSAQTHYLSRRWSEAAPVVPRLQAVTGLIVGGLAQRRHEQLAELGIAALSKECTAHLDAAGGLRSRNPEALLEVFTLLVWAGQAMIDAGRRPDGALEAAVVAMAPVLRGLRHADGGLARFHGGGRGAEGRLDQVLGAAGVRPEPREGPAMGYVRLMAGRTSVIADAAPPPEAGDGAEPHDSALAFELTSGRRPLVVNCGSGAVFGENWRQAGRTVASHSTLELHPGVSRGGHGAGWRATAADDRPVPTTVGAELIPGPAALRLILSHDGFRAGFGFDHHRQLTLSRDGRRLSGEDRLEARGALAGDTPGRFTIRFHLHPDVSVPGASVDGIQPLLLKSGEVWEFWQDGAGTAQVEASVWLEPGQPKPRPCRQIVLSGPVPVEGCQINWTFAKSQGTPLAVRDLVRDDDPQASD